MLAFALIVSLGRGFWNRLEVPMWRFIDGFDECQNGQVREKYNAYAASFDQDFMDTGEGGAGQSFLILNTAFGQAEYLNNFGPATTWGMHAAFKCARAGTSASFPTCDWYVFRGASGVNLLSIRITSAGKMQLWNGSSNSLIAESPAPLSMDTWYFVECLATFGASGHAELRIDGAAVASGSFSSTGELPSIIGFRWQVFGPPSLGIDHHAIYDGQVGAGPTSFIGPGRIISTLPIADALGAWAPSSSGSARYAMVHDNPATPGGSPDGDLTYLAAASTDQLFDVAASACFGRILGLAVNVAGRATAGDMLLFVRGQLSGTAFDLGSVSFAASPQYTVRQVISAENPESGGVWVSATISTGWWGLKGSGFVSGRVSAFYLEQFISLLPVPYSCGGGSYSYSS
jgi:hypothetical protein